MADIQDSTAKAGSRQVLPPNYEGLAKEIARIYLGTEPIPYSYGEYDDGPGYVYFLLANNGWVKIGTALDIRVRTAENHEHYEHKRPFKLIWVIEMKDDRWGLEIDLHRRFHPKRAWCGDWFALSVEDMQNVFREYPSHHALLNELGGV